MKHYVKYNPDDLVKQSAEKAQIFKIIPFIKFIQTVI